MLMLLFIWNKLEQFSVHLSNLLLSLVKKKRLLALDISSSKIQLLELALAEDVYKVTHYASIALAPSLIIDHEIQQSDKLAEAIEILFQSSPSKIKRIISMVPNALVITKEIRLPLHLKPDDVALSVQVEAEKFLMHGREPVYIDYAVLGPTENDSQYEEVAIVASHRSKVDARVSVFNQAGLKVDVLEPEAYAFQRAVEFVLSDEDRQSTLPIAAIDMNTDRMLMIVFHKNRLLFLHEESFAIKELIKMVMDHYKLGEFDAEERIYSNQLDEYFRQDLLPQFLESIAEFIERYLRFFYVKNQHQKIKKILLSGSVLNIHSFSKHLSVHLSLDLEIVNPLEKLAIDEKVNWEILHEAAPGLMISLGLALRGFS